MKMQQISCHFIKNASKKKCRFVENTKWNESIYAREQIFLPKILMPTFLLLYNLFMLKKTKFELLMPTFLKNRTTPNFSEKKIIKIM